MNKEVLSPLDRRRHELGAYLRTRRERLAPSDVGIAPGFRRRTPGLRREEVALLSGVGATWYTWLEQGRDVHPSVEVLNAIAAALRLDPAEKQHLFVLADRPRARAATLRRGVRRGTALAHSQQFGRPARLHHGAAMGCARLEPRGRSRVRRLRRARRRCAQHHASDVHRSAPSQNDSRVGRAGTRGAGPVPLRQRQISRRSILRALDRRAYAEESRVPPVVAATRGTEEAFRREASQSSARRRDGLRAYELRPSTMARI